MTNLNINTRLNIATRRTEFLGKTETVFQLCRGMEVVGVYCTKAEAEAALAAAKQVL